VGERGETRERFVVQLVKPSHYDDDGYVIQWMRAFIPSNSLACVHSLVDDVRTRRALGQDVDIDLDSYDEVHTVIPVRRIVRRIRAAGGRGLVMMVGVQSNQFSRAADLARAFREAGVQVVIGGFHVSGCLAMLSEPPEEIRALQQIGVSLYAGEGEGGDRMLALLRDAFTGCMKPVYNHLSDMPDLAGAVCPQMPVEVARKYMLYTSFDTGRGCPFQCSFCTIINVQGRKSRTRTPDDVERIVRGYCSQGVDRFFVSDDNFSRNRDWEVILDRLIELRHGEGLRFKFTIQVDTTCHRIPGFIEKAARAGCNKVFIGMENINPDNLAAVKKKQNRIEDYRRMLQAWRAQGVLTYAGYILGFPNDTPESIERDIRVIQRELPVDILEFMILTPLPGSEDHKRLTESGVWLDPDMNKYDLEHVTRHNQSNMTSEQLQATYHRAWHQYYTPEHIERLIRRGGASGASPRRIATMIWQFYGSYAIEQLHPLQAGILRRKKRRQRRPGMPLESPALFYPRYLWETAVKAVRIYAMWRRLDRISTAVRRNPEASRYDDVALRPMAPEETARLDLLTQTRPHLATNASTKAAAAS